MKMKLTVQEVVQSVNGTLNEDNLDETSIITGVSTDSRSLNQGELFIPLIGENFDGHDFINVAKDKGAIAVLWQKTKPIPNVDMILILVEDTLTALQEMAKYYLHLVNPRVVGVTGSNGKTTTKDLLSSILSRRYVVHKTKGNLNNQIGLPLTILSMPANTEIAILEMGMSNLGEIELLSNIATPDLAIITNIGESHLEFLKTRENIAKAKLEITKGLKINGSVILLGDEPLLRNQVKEIKNKFHFIWVGKNQDNNIYPIRIEMDGNNHIEFEDNQNQIYHLPLLGTHNVINALMAIEVAKILDITKEDIQKGLSNIKITGMRLEKMKAKNGSTILNDAYNASPSSMKAGIELLASLQQYNKKIVVLGDMLELGGNAEKYHQEVGEFCHSLGVNYLITTGNLGKWIAKGAERSGMDKEKIKFIEKLEEIIPVLMHESDKDTVILVKGSRGLHLEKVINRMI